jgi:hypothetical protein
MQMLNQAEQPVRVEQAARAESRANYSSFKIFSILYGFAYAASFYWDWALFRYYPETREFHWRMTPDVGPPILWYGWLVAAAVISAVVAMVVPTRIADRISSEWVGILAVVAVVGILIYEMRWFV